MSKFTVYLKLVQVECGSTEIEAADLEEAMRFAREVPDDEVSYHFVSDPVRRLVAIQEHSTEEMHLVGDAP